MVSYYESPENFPTKEEKRINKTTKNIHIDEKLNLKIGYSPNRKQEKTRCHTFIEISNKYLSSSLKVSS